MKDRASTFALAASLVFGGVGVLECSRWALGDGWGVLFLAFAHTALGAVWLGMALAFHDPPPVYDPRKDPERRSTDAQGRPIVLMTEPELRTLQEPPGQLPGVVLAGAVGVSLGFSLPLLLGLWGL